ncbi:ABC transporter permease [Gemmobacter fulvus]|uniref:ABC transporter permease n=1 Tax=Gemmobacter fulvus TaxID=2840474 RepID=UPI002796CBD4|nr:ABC transporter permease [Gemmobacter fulvus]MDQ1850610.1 ABC transporter permease [Gemmobacter fulvus]
MTQANNTRLGAGHSRGSVGNTVDSFMRFGALPLILVLCIIIFQVGNDRFLSTMNLTNMSQQMVFLLLIALGQMVVLVSGGFDLSVGATVALTSVLSAKAMVAVAALFPDNDALAIILGFGAALLVGVGCGLVNGIGVAVLKVNAFIVTLATASIFKGVTLVISQGLQVSGLPRPFVYEIGSGRILGLPTSLVMALPVVVMIWLVMHHMRVGRYLYAIGSNMKSAVVAGINVNRQLFAAYVICGAMTAFSGWLLTARVSSGEPLLGGEFPLNSIAAAVIGGCSLRGGEGRVPGVILGVIFITVLANGMDLLRIGSNYQMIALGVVLVGAVVLDRNRPARAVR